MTTTRVCVLVCTAVISTLAQAVAVLSSTSEVVAFKYCIAGTTPCDTTSPIQMSATGGFPGAVASSAALPFTPPFGSASGSVSLSGIVGAPILRASAVSLAGTRANTNSFALQQYTYVGALPETRQFGGHLTYSQTIAPGGPFPPGVGTFAFIEAFTLPGGYEVGATADDNFIALVDPSLQPGYASLGKADFADLNSTAGMVTTDISVTVTLNPGDSIYVWVGLQTPAVDGSVIDASNTFITGWNDATNLLPANVVRAPAAVDALGEPALLILLALGLAGIALARGGLR